VATYKPSDVLSEGEQKALADDHQIIVFTHNIWFAAELLNKADKKKWKYCDIRQEGDDAGAVTAASHPRVDTIAQVSSRVKNMIEGAEKQAGEIRAALVEKGYEERVTFVRSWSSTKCSRASSSVTRRT
jgi:hypothetical protein